MKKDEISTNVFPTKPFSSYKSQLKKVCVALPMFTLINNFAKDFNDSTFNRQQKQKQKQVYCTIAGSINNFYQRALKPNKVISH